MSKTITALTDWIDSGKLLSGREPFETVDAREEFFKTFHDNLVGIGWSANRVNGKSIEQECVFKKDDRQYKLELINEEVYKFSKQ